MACVLCIKDFKAAIKDGHAQGASLRKSFAADTASFDLDDIKRLCETRQVEPNDADLVLPFTISTSSVDRDNDTIDVNGWTNLAEFRANGPVLWGHDSSLPPIARPLDVWVEGDSLKALAEFTPSDMAHPMGAGFGHSIFRMFKGGFMRSTSVGFKPIKFQFNDDRPGGVDFLEQELLEFSAVPIPANPGAVVGAGFDLQPIIEWTERALDGEFALIVPKGDVENFRRLLTGSKGKQMTLDLSAQKTADPVEPTPEPEPAIEDEVKDTIGWASAHPDGTPIADRDMEWDGPAQIAAAEVDDLKVMAAWVDSEDAENKGAYKLPHHVAGGDHALVWRGLTAAMGALLGARGGVDIPEDDRRSVYNHLARHYAEFDEDPPEFRGIHGDDEDEDEEDDKTLSPEAELEVASEAVREASGRVLDGLKLASKSIAKSGIELGESAVADIKDVIYELTSLVEMSAGGNDDYIEIEDEDDGHIGPCVDVEAHRPHSLSAPLRRRS